MAKRKPFVYLEGDFGPLPTGDELDYPIPKYKKTAANYTNSSNATWVNITNLNLTLVAGKSYRIKYSILYNTALSSSGITLQLSGTAVSTSFAGTLKTMTTTTALTGLPTIAMTTPIQFSAAHTAGVPILLEVDLVFVCSTSGVLQLDFRSETNASLKTILAGSIVDYIEV